jgi:hypothetical protein
MSDSLIFFLLIMLVIIISIIIIIRSIRKNPADSIKLMSAASVVALINDQKDISEKSNKNIAIQEGVFIDKEKDKNTQLVEGGKELSYIHFNPESIIDFVPIGHTHIVVDGQNIIHILYEMINGRKNMSKSDYFEYAEYMSQLLVKAIKNKEIHIITKNYGEDKALHLFLLNLSKKYKIFYHLAYDKDNLKSNHYDKARDDILSIKLCKDIFDKILKSQKINKSVCLITNDMHRDHVDFAKTPNFYHYTYKSGKLYNKGIVEPSKLNNSTPISRCYMIFYKSDQNKKINGNIYNTNKNIPCMFIKIK